MKKETVIKLVKGLFIIYCIVLFYILFLYRGRMENLSRIGLFSERHFSLINIVPFKTVTTFLERMNYGNINMDIVIGNLGANLLMFIPMGMALPVLFEKKFNKLWKMTLFIVGFVLLVETIQFITLCGSADIDDLILNTVSCIIGYGIVHIKWLRRFLKLDEQ